MSAEIVLNYYLEKYGTSFNNLSDISFDNLPFLTEKEAIYNMKGQKVSKSYICPKGKEVIRIVYERVIEKFTYQLIEYPNIFVGLRKKILFLDWAGNVAHTKTKQLYAFNLEPVFVADGTETIIGFSSQKQRKVLKEERYCADDYLSSKNPILYSNLYYRYKKVYESYLQTGVSTDFKNAMDCETDPIMLGMLNKEVFGYEPMTVKELIKLNLQ